MLPKLKSICSVALLVLLVASVFVVVELPALSGVAKAQQFSTTSLKYSGDPSFAGLAATGNKFATLVEQSTEFKSLANGTKFYVDPSASYGLSTGPVAQDDYVTVTLFSSNRDAYITADVSNVTGAITGMSFTNLTSTWYRATSCNSSCNWSGYAAQDCESEFLGICTEHYNVAEANGNVQAASSLTAPKTKDECCAIFEWTGVGNSSSGAGLLQGGYAWAGFQLSNLSDSNTHTGYAFFVENFGAGQNAIFIKPPAGFDGVKGQTITLTTEAYAICSVSPIKEDWEEIWQLGSSVYHQQIEGCIQSVSWGYYILESPISSACTGGFGGDICQLPDFGTVSFTGNICYNSSSPSYCIDINSNSNPGLAGWYITHETQDTTTGGIPANGNQWSETWNAPGT